MSETVSTADTSRSRRLLRWLVPLAFLILTGWLVWAELTEFDLADLQRTLITVPTLPALGIAVLALIAVGVTGLVDVMIGRWLGLSMTVRELLRLAFVANSLANTLNLSGAMGAGIRLIGLTSHAVALPQATALIGLQAMSLPLGLALLVILSLAIGSLPVMPGAVTHWLAMVVLAAASLYLPLYFLLTRGRPLMRWLPVDQKLPGWGLKFGITIISLLDWLLAAMVLYACLYLSGAYVKPNLMIGAFAGASVLGLVSLMPGGLGVFDGLMLLSLTSAGYDQPNVLSGLFLFRIIYYLLPLFIGLYFSSSMLAARLPLIVRLRERLASHPLFGILGLPATLLADLGMRLLAIFTFAAGALQLASAAIPAVHEHIRVVREHVPIFAVESSHWFSVLSGVLLLGLARGIDGRLYVAYRLTKWLLVLSAILAVTKGLHFGEALFLTGVALLLRTRRAAFTQRAMSLTSATTFGWYAGLFTVVLMFFAIGVVAVLGDDSFDFFNIGFGEHTSRLARGLAAAMIGMISYLIWQSFAVRRPQPALPGRAELEEAREIYVKHGGGEFAHLTFMNDKSLFWAAGRQTVVAFGVVRDRLVALGSPCGPENLIAQAVLDFRRYADSQGRKPVFYEVFEHDLSLFHDLGFDLFKLGELATVRLSEFSLAGKRWEDLRLAINRSTKEQLAFELVAPPFDTALLADVERISNVWLADRGNREKGYSLGRFDPAYLDWSLLALVRRDHELIAFANVLPPYGPNGTASVDLMRHMPGAPRSTMDFLFAKVMLWSQEQGYAKFSLGMAPLSNVGANPYARVNERLAALAFHYGNKLYNYQGVRKYKEKFKPDWVGAYLAYPRGLWVPGLLIDITALVAGGYRRLLRS